MVEGVLVLVYCSVVNWPEPLVTTARFAVKPVGCKDARLRLGRLVKVELKVATRDVTPAFVIVTSPVNDTAVATADPLPTQRFADAIEGSWEVKREPEILTKLKGGE
jgi:ribosome biogenesis protein Tsr3